MILGFPALSHRFIVPVCLLAYLLWSKFETRQLPYLFNVDISWCWLPDMYNRLPDNYVAMLSAHEVRS